MLSCRLSCLSFTLVCFTCSAAQTSWWFRWRLVQIRIPSQTNYPINFTSAICRYRLAHHFTTEWKQIISVVSGPSWVVMILMKLYVRRAEELRIPILSPITFVDAGVLRIYYICPMMVEAPGNSNASLSPAFVFSFFPSRPTLARFPLSSSLAHNASVSE